MDLLSALDTFVRVVEKGSFSAVARERGVGQPRISKQIAALEERFGTQLIARSQRRMIVLDAGHTLYKASKRMLVELDATIEQLALDSQDSHGTIRVAMPAAFARRFVFPALSKFSLKHPNVGLDISSTDQFQSYDDAPVDLVLHSGELPPTGVIHQELGHTWLITVATPQFLMSHSPPDIPEDLSRLPAVVYLQHGLTRPWYFSRGTGVSIVHPKSFIRTGDPDQLRSAVLGGAGVAQAPLWLFAEDIRSEQLTELFPEYRTAKPIHLLWPRAQRVESNVRVFAKFLERLFSRTGEFHRLQSIHLGETISD